VCVYFLRCFGDYMYTVGRCGCSILVSVQIVQLQLVV